MVRLHFHSPAEFETLFTKQTMKVTDAIVAGIEKAMVDRKK